MGTIDKYHLMDGVLYGIFSNDLIRYTSMRIEGSTYYGGSLKAKRVWFIQSRDTYFYFQLKT